MPIETYKEHFGHVEGNGDMFDMFFDKCQAVPSCTQCRLHRPVFKACHCLTRFAALPYGAEIDKNKMPIEDCF